MKEHIKLILISIPLTFGLLILHNYLLSKGWGISLSTELGIQKHFFLQIGLLLEYVIISIIVAIPYALVITWIVKIKPTLLSKFSVLYFFCIYIIAFLTQQFTVNNSIEGMFNRVIFIICLVLLLIIFLTAKFKQKNA